VGNSYVLTQDISECSLQKLWSTRVWYSTWLHSHSVMVCLAHTLRESRLRLFFNGKPGCNTKMSHFVQSLVQFCVLSIKLSQCRDWIKQTPTCPATTFCARSIMTGMYITSTGPNWQHRVHEISRGFQHNMGHKLTTVTNLNPALCYSNAQHCRPVVKFS
jgi:hypothetical protein